MSQQNHFLFQNNYNIIKISFYNIEIIMVKIKIKKDKNDSNKIKKISKKLMYYPEFSDKDFYEKIYIKKEFFKNKIPRDNKLSEDVCNARLFNLAPQQEFLRNYISIDTPYNGILIYHGTGVGKTCSGIQIAEGFKDIMKRMHIDNRRKITILLSRRILPQFKDQIYDINKELKKERPDDIVQCTGNTYSLNYDKYSGLTIPQKKKETSRLVNSHYQFYGYEEFANELMNEIGWNGKKSSLTDIQKRAIRTKFQNRILIIDEIHNIKSNTAQVELRKVPPILQAIITYGENIRLVLMSATPMYDNANEIIYILNLLLLNDGRPPIKKNEIFDGNENLVPGGAERLKEISKGYISYLRGENPTVFPLKITPENASIPKIKYDIYGKVIPMSERYHKLKLIQCKMSDYHYNEYLKKLKVIDKLDYDENDGDNNIVDESIEDEDTDIDDNNINIKKNNSNKYANSLSRRICNIILPDKNGDSNPKKDQAYQSVDNGRGSFVVDMGKIDDSKKKRKTYQFRYQSHLRFKNDKSGGEVPFLDESILKKYSSKFYNALMNIKNGKGICYVYSEFIWAGVLPFAMMLEQNGFERYPWSGERPLLDYPKKRNPICALCSNSALSPIHDENTPNYHEFKRARYILISGDMNISAIETSNLINIINNSNNKYGDEVKVVIGTKLLGEGLDFKRIRQVHIIEPWFNLSRIDQTTGRASRWCSHSDLPKADRNVEVFLYAVIPPDSATKLQKETETIDTRVYRVAEIKDRKIKEISYILKKSAVDCVLNKNGNVFDFDGKSVEMISSLGRKVRISLEDNNGSRECDYRECDYKCVWEPDKKKFYKINIDTYNERFARSDINKSKVIIKKLYENGYVYVLDELVKVIRENMKNLELQFIYIAITEMINNQDQPIYDMYKRRGYMIHKGPYYIFQPLEFTYSKAPLLYRMVPFSEKTNKYVFSNDINYNNNNQSFIKNQAKNSDILSNIIKTAEMLINEIESTDKNKMYIILTQIVDKLSDKNKNTLLKKIIVDYNDSNGNMTNPYLVLLFEYFEPLFLYKYRDLELGRGDKLKDILIGYYYIFNHISIDNNTVKNVMKIFCYNTDTKLVGECRSDIRDKIKLNMKIKMSKEIKNSVKNFNIIYGFMTLKDGPYVFKIYDGTRDTGAVTLDMKKSKRSEMKGKECDFHSIIELNDISKKLNIKISGTHKKKICLLFEYKLREYDYNKIDGKRWFLNSIQSMKMSI
jgi:superfamily II DNA or RNA helicase